MVRSVDPLEREIAVSLPTGHCVFYVPPDCPTYLRGERIKLRIVQPGDAVRVTFAWDGAIRSVMLLEICPRTSYSTETHRTRKNLPGIDKDLAKSHLA